MILTRATTADLPEVLALLNDAAARLHARGISQWPRPFGQDRIGPMIGRGDVLIVRDGGIPAATAAVAAAGDPDFWTARELAEPASYVSKAARAGGYAGLGEMLLRWITDAADARGDRWVRLDAWRDNPGLHAYYARRRWQHVRTVPAPHRNSGALFQRLALADPVARAGFTSDVCLPPRPPAPWVPVVIRTAMGVAYSPSDHGVA